ncbi:MAG: 5'-3' exonuclease [Kiritimatiellia bacterium]
MIAGTEPRLLLLDGHAAVYRFYFGIRPMTSPCGTPVQAVFGFIRMMQLLRDQFRPSHVAVAFDGGLPEKRLRLVPDYKAHRKPMPDDLRVQLPIVQSYLTAADIPFFCMDAVEADDIIATLASRFQGDVCIGTSDKDMYQLVNEHISIVPLSGMTEPMGPLAVQAKTGVLPGGIADWLALTGDAADNIRGVRGVGPKTAASLLGEFGTIAGIYQNLDMIPRAKLRQALRESAELVWRNREMVLLDLAIPGLPDIDDLRAMPEPVTSLQSFYQDYGFKAFATKLREPDLFSF